MFIWKRHTIVVHIRISKWNEHLKCCASVKDEHVTPIFIVNNVIISRVEGFFCVLIILLSVQWFCYVLFYVCGNKFASFVFVFFDFLFNLTCENGLLVRFLILTVIPFLYYLCVTMCFKLLWNNKNDVTSSALIFFRL